MQKTYCHGFAQHTVSIKRAAQGEQYSRAVHVWVGVRARIARAVRFAATEPVSASDIGGGECCLREGGAFAI